MQKTVTGHVPTLQKKPDSPAQTASHTPVNGGSNHAEANRPPQQARPAAGGRAVTEAQGRRFYAVARNNGHDNDAINQYLQAEFGVRKSDQIPADRYEAAIRWADGKVESTANDFGSPEEDELLVLLCYKCDSCLGKILALKFG